MTAELYPHAEWRGDGVPGGEYFSSDGHLGPWRIVLHTTETAAIPGYNNGKSAPHLTYQPATRRWVQHTKLTIAARALRNVIGGVQTNRERALQVEIVCYSQKSVADQSASRLWVGDLTDDHLTDLAGFLTWCRDNFNVEMSWPGRQALSYAEANAAGFRMSDSVWDQYGAVCGHQHVPENTHWDPGALDWGRLLAIADGGDNMPDPRITDEEAAFLRDMRNSTVAVNSNATFPQTIIPWYRDNKTIGARVDALEEADNPTSSGLQSGDLVQIEKVDQP